MNNNIKKIIATAIATGTVVTGASLGINKANCDFVIQHKGENICITKEVKEAIDEQIKANATSVGFGSIGFGGKIIK